MLRNGSGRVVNWRRVRHHSNYSIVEIYQNTEKSPGDLKRLAVTPTPGKVHYLGLEKKLNTHTHTRTHTHTHTRTIIIIIIIIKHGKSWTWLKKGNLKRETEFLLIAAQNSALRTNHIKPKIDKTQQNSKCRLCGDKDETINHIISECSQLEHKEYKARHDWVGKVIHWEICKKFKFDHTDKWYMHNPAPVQENDTHKLLWDFNIQTDHLISATRRDLIITNKKKENLQNCRLCCSGWPQNKTEIMWKER